MDPLAALQAIIDEAQELAMAENEDRAWHLDEITERVEALRKFWGIKAYPAT